MCNPWSSIQWLKEANELGLWDVDKKTLNNLEKFSWFEDEKARSMLIRGLEFVDRLNFLGGEPLLIKEHLQLLEECIAQGRAKEIVIQYNTNLTYIPEKIREIWKHFKSVELNLSCDGFKELNEYIRFPVKWDAWLNNVKTIAEWRSDVNLNLSLHSTFQSLNVTRLPMFYDWTWDFMSSLGLPRIPFVIYVTQPDYCDPRHLPEEVKNLVIKEHNLYFERVEKQNLTHMEKMWLSMIKGHIQTFATPTPASEAHWKKFIENTSKVDVSRQQSILNVLPEFEKYFSRI
jgi:sulfatase maturation enzyme AslB (radical SAM superfamily)